MKRQTEPTPGQTTLPPAKPALREYAAPGLHQFCAALVKELAKPEDLIIDLAAGTGAFAARLHELGLTRIVCNDLNRDNFAFAGAPCTGIDLNTDFAAALGREKYDLAVAMEVVEHLENPRHFLRECFAILKEGGYLLLTTPHLGSVRGRLLFLRSGHLRDFTPRNLEHDGHITPLLDWLLAYHLQCAGFRIVRTYFPPKDNRRIRELLLDFVAGLAGRLLLGLPKDYACGRWTVFLARKEPKS